jgi:hypothetical protein
MNNKIEITEREFEFFVFGLETIIKRLENEIEEIQHDLNDPDVFPHDDKEVQQHYIEGAQDEQIWRINEVGDLKEILEKYKPMREKLDSKYEEYRKWIDT